MNWLRKAKARFQALFSKEELDAKMDDEMRSHIEMQTQENIEAGMKPEEARYAALRQFGWVESIKDTCREQRGVSWIENLGQDIRYGARMLRKNPGFTTVAVLTLALGIGANTAIFSFINAILLRPLPYKDSDRLVMVFENHPGNGWFKNAVGAPVLAEWRKQSTVFEGFGARDFSKSTLTGKGTPETLGSAHLSANLFGLLGVQPILGRNFLPEEETFGKHHVVLLSYELWQRRFGSDAAIIGQSITLDSEPKAVIGIMPPRTHFPNRDTQLWLPLAFSWELQARQHHAFLVYGKLKPGVSIQQASAEMKLIAERMAANDERNKGWGVEVHGLQDIIVGDVRRLFLVLLAAVGMVLLIACANLSNLLLTRSTARAREFSIRMALGARRGQLIRQLLTEGLVLCLAGGVGGVLFAAGGLQGLIRLSPADLPRVWEGVRLDGTTLAFTAIVTLVTGLLFNLLPAMRASKPALVRELTESARGSAGLQHVRTRSLLIVSEVALSVVLLIAAGLFIRSFGRLLTQNFGFNPEQVVSMHISLPGQRYPGQAERERVFDRLLTMVRALPGVQSAGTVLGLPLGGWNNTQIPEIIGAPPHPGSARPLVGYAQVSPGYFATMRIPLLEGRDFNEHDTTNTTPVLIVDETFVRKFNLDTNVLGRRVKKADTGIESEIVGVVKDVKRFDPAQSPYGGIYRSYKQLCWGQMTLVLRTSQDLPEVTRAVRNVLDQLDKDLPLENVRTMTQLVESSVAQRKLSVQLLGGFAGVAMLLAAIGLYGVLAYNVAQRTREIGIRTALGAQRSDILALVLGHGMKLAGFGLVLGLAVAFALTRVLRSHLYEVGTTDPMTFVSISLLLIVVGLLACLIPARRAMKVDPMVALRYE